MTEVTIAEVERRLNSGEEVTLVDARAPQVWDEAKKKAGGAIRIPPDAAEQYLNRVSRDDYIVIYCT